MWFESAWNKYKTTWWIAVLKGKVICSQHSSTWSRINVLEIGLRERFVSQLVRQHCALDADLCHSRLELWWKVTAGRSLVGDCFKIADDYSWKMGPSPFRCCITLITANWHNWLLHCDITWHCVGRPVWQLLVQASLKIFDNDWLLPVWHIVWFHVLLWTLLCQGCATRQMVLFRQSRSPLFWSACRCTGQSSVCKYIRSLRVIHVPWSGSLFSPGLTEIPFLVASTCLKKKLTYLPTQRRPYSQCHWSCLEKVALDYYIHVTHTSICVFFWKLFKLWQ